MTPGIARRFVSPISNPGPRLLRELPRGIARGLRKRGRPALGFDLPMLPLVDMMLGLVAFLLSIFAAEATCGARHQVPSAENWIDSVHAPLLAVTPGVILVDGVPTGITRDVLDGGRVGRIDELFGVLKAKRELWRQLNPELPFPGVLVLEVDRAVPALAVKSVVHTAALSGYPNLSFLVEAR
jgi:hypothetical protein